MDGESWTEFRLRAFGEPYLVWHDGPDFTAFQDAWTVDPISADRMLREGLATGDPLAAEAVGFLRLSPSQSEAYARILRDALQGAHGAFVIRCADTLRKLTGDSSWAHEVVKVLLGVDHWGVRIDAAILLSRFSPNVELIAAAMRGVQDAEYLVRYHSANTLLGWADRPHEISEDAELFPLLVAEDSPEKWSIVASGLAGAASARLAAG
ncbi:hypothetical protein BH10ACT7_BH10ACT7_03310 [soil metagenome]